MGVRGIGEFSVHFVLVILLAPQGNESSLSDVPAPPGRLYSIEGMSTKQATRGDIQSSDWDTCVILEYLMEGPVPAFC